MLKIDLKIIHHRLYSNLHPLYLLKMAQQISSISNINVNAFKFTDVKTRDLTKSVYFYHSGKSLFFQTPLLTTPFGLSSWDDGKFSLNVSLTDEVLLNKIKEIEDRFIDEGVAQSMPWFKKAKASRDVVAELYTSTIRYPKNKEGEITDQYPPTLKITLPYKDGKIDCAGYRKIKSTGEVTEMEITKENIFGRCNLVAIIKCTSIWIIGNKFGCTFKAEQIMRVDPDASVVGGGSKRLGAFAFIEDADDDDAASSVPVKGVAVEEDDE